MSARVLLTTVVLGGLAVFFGACDAAGADSAASKTELSQHDLEQEVESAAASEAEQEALADPEERTEITRHRQRDVNRLGDLYALAKARAETEISAANAEKRLRALERAVDQDIANLNKVLKR